MVHQPKDIRNVQERRSHNGTSVSYEIGIPAIIARKMRLKGGQSLKFTYDTVLKRLVVTKVKNSTKTNNTSSSLSTIW